MITNGLDSLATHSLHNPGMRQPLASWQSSPTLHPTHSGWNLAIQIRVKEDIITASMDPVQYLLV